MKLNYLLQHIRNILVVFSHCDGLLSEFGPFSLQFIFLWNRKPWLDHLMFIITLECSNFLIWIGIYFREISLKIISRGANNCVQRVFENFFHNDISPHFKFVLSNKWKVIFFNNSSKGLTMQIHFHSHWSYIYQRCWYLWSWLCMCVCTVCIYIIYIKVFVWFLCWTLCE